MYTAPRYGGIVVELQTRFMTYIVFKHVLPSLQLSPSNRLLMIFVPQLGARRKGESGGVESGEVERGEKESGGGERGEKESGGAERGEKESGGGESGGEERMGEVRGHFSELGMLSK